MSNRAIAEQQSCLKLLFSISSNDVSVSNPISTIYSYITTLTTNSVYLSHPHQAGKRKIQARAGHVFPHRSSLGLIAKIFHDTLYFVSSELQEFGQNRCFSSFSRFCPELSVLCFEHLLEQHLQTKHFFSIMTIKIFMKIGLEN